MRCTCSLRTSRSWCSPTSTARRSACSTPCAAATGLAGVIDPNTPIIVLTGRANELDRVRVFDRGGDDVVPKPFSYPELRGRIRVLLRRAYESRAAPVSRIGALIVNHSAREVRIGERQVDLAPKEFEQLQTLDRRPHPRVHPSGAATRRLGLPNAQQDGRQPRVPAQTEARQLPPPAGHQRPRRRLPAVRPSGLPRKCCVMTDRRVRSFLSCVVGAFAPSPRQQRQRHVADNQPSTNKGGGMRCPR